MIDDPRLGARAASNRDRIKPDRHRARPDRRSTGDVKQLKPRIRRVHREQGRAIRCDGQRADVRVLEVGKPVLRKRGRGGNSRERGREQSS
jgi:hypothetical protein